MGDLSLVMDFPGNQGKTGSSIVGKELKMYNERGKRIMKEDGGDWDRGGNMLNQSHVLMLENV